MRIRLLGLIFFLSAGLSSCGLFKRTPKTEIPEKQIMRNEMIQKIRLARTEVPYIHAKLKISFDDGQKKQSLTATLEYVKDTAIMLALSKFGLPVGRVLITPGKAAFYENINRTAFEGDPALLAQRFGIPLDFQMLQDALLGNVDAGILENGQAEIQLQTSADYAAEIIPGNRDGILQKTKVNSLFKVYESLWQYKDFPLLIRYPDYDKKTLIPNEILLFSGPKSARIEWKRVKFPDHIDIRFHVPANYRRIRLEE